MPHSSYHFKLNECSSTPPYTTVLYDIIWHHHKGRLFYIILKVDCDQLLTSVRLQSMQLCLIKGRRRASTCTRCPLRTFSNVRRAKRSSGGYRIVEFLRVRFPSPPSPGLEASHDGYSEYVCSKTTSQYSYRSHLTITHTSGGGYCSRPWVALVMICEKVFKTLWYCTKYS
jgi:hypothetical protein